MSLKHLFESFGYHSDAKQTPRLDLLFHARVLNQVGSILTLGQGLGPPLSMLTWDP